MGRIITASKATVSRIENGIERLDAQRAALLDKAWETGGVFSILIWYASIGHDPQWLAQYKTFEQRARIMREQLAHVLEMAEQPNIVVHVIPHPGVSVWRSAISPRRSPSGIPRTRMAPS
ncbi:hypothetical protein GCM10009735_39220 [Actinomadura chokoriensis]